MSITPFNLWRQSNEILSFGTIFHFLHQIQEKKPHLSIKSVQFFITTSGDQIEVNKNEELWEEPKKNNSNVDEEVEYDYDSDGSKHSRYRGRRRSQSPDLKSKKEEIKTKHSDIEWVFFNAFDNKQKQYITLKVQLMEFISQPYKVFQAQLKERYKCILNIPKNDFVLKIHDYYFLSIDDDEYFSLYFCVEQEQIFGKLIVKEEVERQKRQRGEQKVNTKLDNLVTHQRKCGNYLKNEIHLYGIDVPQKDISKQFYYIGRNQKRPANLRVDPIVPQYFKKHFNKEDYLSKSIQNGDALQKQGCLFKENIKMRRHEDKLMEAESSDFKQMIGVSESTYAKLMSSNQNNEKQLVESRGEENEIQPKQSKEDQVKQMATEDSNSKSNLITALMRDNHSIFDYHSSEIFNIIEQHPRLDCFKLTQYDRNTFSFEVLYHGKEYKLRGVKYDNILAAENTHKRFLNLPRTCSNTFIPIISCDVSMIKDSSYILYLEEILDQKYDKIINFSDFMFDKDEFDLNKRIRLLAWMLTKAKLLEKELNLPPSYLFKSNIFICIKEKIPKKLNQELEVEEHDEQEDQEDQDDQQQKEEDEVCDYLEDEDQDQEAVDQDQEAVDQDQQDEDEEEDEYDYYDCYDEDNEDEEEMVFKIENPVLREQQINQISDDQLEKRIQQLINSINEVITTKSVSHLDLANKFKEYLTSPINEFRKNWFTRNEQTLKKFIYLLKKIGYYTQFGGLILKIDEDLDLSLSQSYGMRFLFKYEKQKDINKRNQGILLQELLLEKNLKIECDLEILSKICKFFSKTTLPTKEIYIHECNFSYYYLDLNEKAKKHYPSFSDTFQNLISLKLRITEANLFSLQFLKLDNFRQLKKIKVEFLYYESIEQMEPLFKIFQHKSILALNINFKVLFQQITEEKQKLFTDQSDDDEFQLIDFLARSSHLVCEDYKLFESLQDVQNEQAEQEWRVLSFKEVEEEEESWYEYQAKNMSERYSVAIKPIKRYQMRLTSLCQQQYPYEGLDELERAFYQNKEVIQLLQRCLPLTITEDCYHCDELCLLRTLYSDKPNLQRLTLYLPCCMQLLVNLFQDSDYLSLSKLPFLQYLKIKISQPFYFPIDLRGLIKNMSFKSNINSIKIVAYEGIRLTQKQKLFKMLNLVNFKIKYIPVKSDSYSDSDSDSNS